MQNNRWYPHLTHVMSGAVAGAAATIITCPLDVIKTRLQVQRASATMGPAFNGVSTFSGTLRATWHREGLRGFYHGAGTTMLALVPNWAIYFATYSESKRLLTEGFGYEENAKTHMISAVMAGITTDIFVNPLWLIKTRLQTQEMRGRIIYRGIWHAFRKIVRGEGVLALWHGLSPQIVGVLHVAVQFPLYEKLKLYLRQRKGEEELNWLELVAASSGAKVVASVAAYPHEVVRARFQHQHHTDHDKYHSLRDVIARIPKEEGWLSFYRGMGTNLLRVLPSCAVTFTVYELVQRHLSTPIH
ncbi:Nicotinamide adenine dinucleotide transporter 2, mitochondrial, variant 2 [Balamuthia mandrillaris]